MNARDLRVLAAAAVGVATMTGCAAPPQWRDLGDRAVSFETAWNAVVETSTRHGFTPDDRGTDRGRGLFQSRWRSWTQGFGQSRRMRMRAELERAEAVDESLVWHLRFCVERQSVPDMARSMNPRESDWVSDGQDRDFEDVIEAQLRLRFGDRVVAPARAAQ
ncbi:MAG: hypothetical protein R3F56_04225 [Planctomycetota bacterium]